MKYILVILIFLLIRSFLKSYFRGQTPTEKPTIKKQNSNIKKNKQWDAETIDFEEIKDN
ncbi:MAG: hypothetical protein H6604_00650 [Flavobacteriales bacterium]|nr:hypothetical protein [Flavobacteriales bacterium]